MDTMEAFAEPVPAPAALVALVQQLVAGRWPRADEERERLFAGLGFASAVRSKVSQSSSLEMLSLDAGLAGDVSTQCSVWQQKFLGITFLAYGSLHAKSPGTRRGYDLIWRRLVELFGEPTRPWDDEAVPPAIWKANGRDITIHLFDRRDSCLLLSIEDSALAAAALKEASTD